MRILLAALFLVLDAARSWVAWHTRGLRRLRRLRRGRENPNSHPDPGNRTFTNPTAADRVATAQLLATRPGTVRRVVAH